MANQKQALQLCKYIEEKSAPIGWHVALTGGTLYKEGERKDIDLMFYTHGHDASNLGSKKQKLFKLLSKEFFFKIGKDYGFVTKSVVDDTVAEPFEVDILIPEAIGGEYPASNNIEGGTATGTIGESLFRMVNAAPPLPPSVRGFTTPTSSATTTNVFTPNL